MKIAFFALSRRKHGGVYQYTLSAIEAFKTIAQRNGLEITFIHSGDYSDCFSKPADQWSSVDLARTGISRDVFLATYFGKGLNGSKKRAFDIAISPKTCLAGYRTGHKCIVTLHDLQHKHFPQYFRLHRRMLRDILYSRSVRLSDLTVCNSKYVKDDIINYYDVDPAKIIVLRPPPPSYILSATVDEDTLQETRDRYNLPAEYLFYPAQFWFHKNHRRLFKAMEFLKSAYGIDIPLVLVGSANGAFHEAMRELRRLKLESRVKYLGYVPNSEMPALFKLSSGVVLPTLYESLCIPMWEAFSLEVPVVCSNVCGLPEQAGDAAIFCNPYDPEDIARRIRELLCDRDKSKKLIRKGKDRLTLVSPESYANTWMQLIGRLES